MSTLYPDSEKFAKKLYETQGIFENIFKIWIVFV